MEDSIYLYSRGDRLGSHLIQYISIIIYAYYNNLYIVYEPKKVNYNSTYNYEGNLYGESFFVKAILNWIDNHNKKFPKKNYLEKYNNINTMEYLLDFEIKFNPNKYFYTCDLLIITTQVLYNIHNDLISYFKKYIWCEMNNYIKKCIPNNFQIPFNPKKTILVHLRLGDVKDRKDYDGSICSNFYKKRIDNGSNIIKGIANLGYCNMQAPLSRHKVENAIMEAKRKYPEHEVIIITAPGDYDIDYPSYKCIRNDNENYDLYLLCNADILILSRSTFSLASAFFGTAREIWCPLWGHFITSGLHTKYDNSKFNYFF